jgi:hypothetical protein
MRGSDSIGATLAELFEAGTIEAGTIEAGTAALGTTTWESSALEPTLEPSALKETCAEAAIDMLAEFVLQENTSFYSHERKKIKNHGQLVK